jgi:hypothetical protein
MVSVLKIIVYVLLFSLPSVQLVRDWKYHDKRTRRYRLVTRAMLVVYLLLVVPSALFLWLDAVESSRTKEKLDEVVTGKNDLLSENRQLRSQMQDSQKELIRRADEQAVSERQLGKKSDEIAALYKSIAESQRDLRKKSDENAALYKSIASTVTGGDSYCYLTPVDEGTTPLLLLVHQGKFPLYDISLRIVDLNKWSQLKQPITLDSVNQTHTILNAGNLAPSHTIQVGKLSLPDGDSQDFNIFVSARNGFFTELLRCRRVKGQWVYALRVTNTNSNAIWFEKIWPDYPRDAMGQVQW